MVKTNSNMFKEQELDVSMKCVKYMLFVANFMFVLVGFLLLSIGSTIKAIYISFDHFLSDHFYSASNLAIAVGFIIFMVALFGCVGAVKESVCLINTYALFLLFILVLEIAVSVVAYATRSNLQTQIELKMYDSMNYYDSYTQLTWNATQSNMYCCGVRGPDDWNKFRNVSSYLPYTVTVQPDPDLETQIYQIPVDCCTNADCNKYEDIFQTGCLDRVILLVSESALLLGIGAMCVSFIQMLGVVFAHLLAKSVRKLKTQMLVERNERRQALYEQLARSNSEKPVQPVLYTPTSFEA